jgi:hypothetical protein
MLRNFYSSLNASSFVIFMHLAHQQVSGISSFFCSCFERVVPSGMAPTPRTEKWRNSKARYLLEQDLVSGAIPLESSAMKPSDVYMQRHEFSSFEYKHFRDRLRELRKNILAQKDCAISDHEALIHDRQMHPKPVKNHRGEPRWEGSEAERLLRLDMDAGLHNMMKPKDLYVTRVEYSNSYPLFVFRKHIYQEEQRRKFLAHYYAKQQQKIINHLP